MRQSNELAATRRDALTGPKQGAARRRSRARLRWKMPHYAFAALSASVVASTACGRADAPDVDADASAATGTTSLLDANTESLEGGLGRWEPWFSSTIARSTAAAEAGTEGLKVRVTDPYGWGVQFDNWPGFAAKAGPKVLSFWAKSGTPHATSMSMTVHWRTTAGDDLRADTLTLEALTGAWQQRRVNVTAPSGTTRVWVELTGDQDAAVGDIVYVDEVVVADASGGAGGAGQGGGGHAAGGSTGSAGHATGGAAGAGGSAGHAAGGAAGAGGSAASACTNPTCVVSNDGCTEGDYYLYDNQWNCGGNDCGKETTYACSYNSWYVTSNQPAGNTAVLTYPSVQKNFDDHPAVSSFHTITSKFAEQSPHVGDYEVAYDIWLNGEGNGNSNELMIWVDNYNQVPGGDKVASNVSIGGHTYDVWWDHGSYSAFVTTSNLTSGTIDILAIFNYAIQHSILPASSTLWQLSYGVEVCSTNGKNATWYFNDYGVTAN